MTLLYNLLVVVFVINCIFLLLIILLQSSRSSGMSLFGGGGQSAFGSSSADVLTKTTAVLATSFILLALVIAYIRTHSYGTDDLRKEFETQAVQGVEGKVAGEQLPTQKANNPTTDVK